MTPVRYSRATFRWRGNLLWLLLVALLALAKLCKSTNRATDAHAVLSPALEGFSPTLEFPEIEEAQRLLAGLTS